MCWKCNAMSDSNYKPSYHGILKCFFAPHYELLQYDLLETDIVVTYNSMDFPTINEIETSNKITIYE